jgi:hypothetical protein
MSDYNDSEYARSYWKEAAGVRPTGTRKIADLPKTCNHPGHNPPMHQFFQDGVYAHICPGCGAIQHFTVVNPKY